MTKKKAAPKKAAPKRRQTAKWSHPEDIDLFLRDRRFPLRQATSSYSLRIGSIVRYKNEGTMIVLWRDDNELERKNTPDPKARYTWQGICLSNPNYEEFMFVSDKMIEGGEAEIIGHFDFFGLVQGNGNR